jgi:hypothetical protein
VSPRSSASRRRAATSHCSSEHLRRRRVALAGTAKGHDPDDRPCGSAAALRPLATQLGFSRPPPHTSVNDAPGQDVPQGLAATSAATAHP